MVEIPDQISRLLPKPWRDMSAQEKEFTGALIAYAAGDAFGAYYEFTEIVSEVPNELRGKEDWPFGGTSDDTSLTILTLLSLSEESPQAAAQQFLRLLHSNQESLRGLGPTTRAALGLPVKEREVASIGFTNGAMMRTALLGLIFKDSAEREIWVRELASATHRSYAVATSLAISSAFAGEKIESPASWQPENLGVSNDALETLHAVGFVSQRARTPLEAMRHACRLGGDTDTVAALSAGLISLSPQQLENVFEISWLENVDWNGISGFTEALNTVFNRLAKQ